MKRITIPLLIILGLIAVLFLGVISASAQAIKMEFSSWEALNFGAPGRVWVSDDGVLHVRDQPAWGPVWGDITGTLNIVSNINLDTATGNGNGFGPALLEVDYWEGLSGTFEGRSQWKFTYGVVTSGQFVGHGTDELEGMQMKADFYVDDDGQTRLVGMILITEGR